MAKKQEHPHNLQGPVLLKSQKTSESESQKAEISFEHIDQENKIKLTNDLIPYSASYRFSILLKNESLAPITEIKAIIKFPAFLKLSRYSPLVLESKQSKSDKKGYNQLQFEIEELSEKSETQITCYFSPNSNNNIGELNTYITFVNNKDYIRVINSKPIEIRIKPVTIQPKIIPSSKITNFLKIKDIKKGIKSLGIPSKKNTNMDLFFNFIDQNIKLHKFQLIAKDNEKKIAWYFGTDLASNQDILVIGQVVSNKVEFLAASQNHQIIISLLSNLSDSFKKRAASIGGMIRSIKEIYDLECKYCGAVLPYFPSKGESIECKTCKKEQILW
jgi:hypothetical protein